MADCAYFVSGDHDSIALLSGCGIPGAANDQALRLQNHSPGHDDVVGDRLFVAPIQNSHVRLKQAAAWAQAWMTGRTSFYITRALIGACEGGFIPGTILFTTYFYKSRELSVRLAAFWSTLNVCSLRFIHRICSMQLTDIGGTSHLLVTRCWDPSNARYWWKARLVLVISPGGPPHISHRIRCTAVCISAFTAGVHD